MLRCLNSSKMKVEAAPKLPDNLFPNYVLSFDLIHFYTQPYIIKIQIWHKQNSSRSSNTSASTSATGNSTPPSSPSRKNLSAKATSDAYARAKPNSNKYYAVPPPKAKAKHNSKRKAESLSKSIKKYYKQADRSSLYQSIYYKSSITSKKEEENIKHSIKQSKTIKYNSERTIKSSSTKEE